MLSSLLESPTTQLDGDRAPSTRRGLIEVEPGLGGTNQNPPGIGFWALIREDLRTHGGDWLAQGFWALAVHRYGNWRMSIRPRWLRMPFSLLYRILFKLVEWTCGISVSYTTRIGRRVHIWHQGGMQLGARSIGDDVHIRQNTTFGIARTGDPNWAKPVIEDRVDIGCHACILGGITVGHDSVIGAHTLVLKDVPPFAVVVGVPGRIVKYRDRGGAASPVAADRAPDVAGDGNGPTSATQRTDDIRGMTEGSTEHG